MQVEKNAVVTIDYTLKDAGGLTIDTSVGKQPLPYLHGTGTLIPGLEKALEGKNAGEKVQVTLPPAEGYGVRDETLVQAVPRSAFQGVPNMTVGMQFRTAAQGGGNGSVVTVTKIEGDTITVDGNHPLAGATLSFDVDIREVRKATQEELVHGHVHGPGGHHHH